MDILDFAQQTKYHTCIYTPMYILFTKTLQHEFIMLKKLVLDHFEASLTLATNTLPYALQTHTTNQIYGPLQMSPWLNINSLKVIFKSVY